MKTLLKDMKLWLSIGILMGVFILSSYLAQTYNSNIQNYMHSSGPLLGTVLYFAVSIASTVVAPLSDIPFISIISNIWGSLFAGILAIIGWTIGGLIAFTIARRYGKPIVLKIVSEQNLNRIKQVIPDNPKRAFWTIVLLRILIPADILSYAIGLFTNIKTGTYALGTLLGVAPSAMLFAYTGTLPIKYQILVLLSGMAIIAFILSFWIRHVRDMDHGMR